MTPACAYTPRDLRNIRNFNIAALAAMSAFVAATILIGKGFIERGPLAWSIVVVAIVLMLFMVRSYIHFLRHADELLRKIQLEGLALGFGAGVVFMLSWRLCERLGAFKLDLADGVLPMVLFWAIGQYRGYRRYFSGGEEDEQ